MRSARSLAVLVAAALAAVASGQDAPENRSIAPVEKKSADLEATIDLSLATSMEGPASAPLRLLSDEATVKARIRFRAVETRAGGGRVLEGTPRSLEIRRRFRLRADGFFSEDRRDELG